MSKLKTCTETQLHQLKPYLDQWVERIEQPSYITSDPVSFMHAFNDPEDKAIAGFFAAIFAWGRRDIVIAKVENLLNRMSNQPAAFVQNFTDDMRPIFDGFKHRTFKPIDIYWLVKCLQEILKIYGSFEAFWTNSYAIARETNQELITVFHHSFFDLFEDVPKRTHKHISNADKGSSCKRLYLYLRWVIRKGSPVDPGIMDFMNPSKLMIPLDVHTARQARALGLLTRTYNDWKAVQELTRNARRLDPNDPAKYDYALFGIGVEGHKIPDEFLLNPQILE